MQRIKIVQLLSASTPADRVLIKGWVRTKRDAKDFSFLEINDGSCLANIQVIAVQAMKQYDSIRKLTTGSAVAVTGDLVPSQGKGQQWEIRATDIVIIQIAPESYPLQKKRHTDEYLRTIAHLRLRTNKYGAAFRIRSELSFAVHQFFHERGFRYIHTPVLTGSDCEGAGEMFRVSTLPPGNTDISQDFFGREANLTVSGQLEAEMASLALGDVYTFGPTFRAENSNTRRHAAEFWMIEPEMAFCELDGCMAFAEEMIQYLIGYLMQSCSEDLSLFARFVDKNLTRTLENIVQSNFEHLTYGEAINILERSRQKFNYPFGFGQDLQSEHERYITETVFKKPVIITDYPKAIKPFYMRLNDDLETVAAMDVLVPGIGEIMGGSQREERLNVLSDRMKEQKLPEQDYWWYQQSREYGSVPHSGFGLGFERLLMLATGIRNIRDVILFPRTPKNIEF